MFGYDHGGWMFGGGGWGMILIWLVPIALAIWFFSSLGTRSGQGSTEKTALDILKERYARGDIGQDEFEQKKRDISDAV
jgi:putative membrane protein